MNSICKVDCPIWLQRGMIRNLEKESRNRVSPDRALRAKVILNEIHNPCDNSCNRGPVESSRPEMNPVHRHKPPMITRIFRFMVAAFGWIIAAVRHVWRRRSE